MKEIELLKNSLLENSPILLIGSGFSKGAKNRKGKELVCSEDLASELYEKVIKNKLSKEIVKDIDKELNNSKDLKKICTICRDAGVLNERNNYLTERFSGVHCDKKDYHMSIKDYPWTKIYSLNIDDFLEFIYSDKINITGNEGEYNCNYPILSKLHGDVKKTHHGYIFDDKEYVDNTFDENFGLADFTTDFFRKDVIFLGTEFQEYDINRILDKFLNMTTAYKSQNYFFISPQINSWSLKQKIKNNSNYYHIEMNTERFLNFIHSEVCIKSQAIDLLKTNGARFLRDEKRETHSSIVGNIYQGGTPLYSEIFEEYDIEYPKYKNWIREVKTFDKSSLICIVGDSYSGKTCIAMRALVDLFNDGYTALSYPFTSALDTISYQKILIQYLQILPEGAKVAVLVENGSIDYGALLNLLNKCPSRISKFIIISTSNNENHKSKEYILKENENVLIEFISYKINSLFAENIYNKLQEKTHISKLRDYGENKKSIIKVIKDINDIIEVLYVSQEGRRFAEYFKSWIEMEDNDINSKVFYVLCLLTELGIDGITPLLAKNTLMLIKMDFNFDEFFKKYNKLIKLEENQLKIRCFRIIQKIINDKLSKEEIKNVIYNMAMKLGTQLRDRDSSYNYEIFQKIIKVKQLKKKNLLDDQTILDILVNLQSSCNHLSYYWIQRGIAHRNLDKFEEANNAFNQAISVRNNNSYCVKHAMAKNYLAWGIWALTNKHKEQFEMFNKGKDMLLNLLNEGESFKYYGYSLHTYIDMNIKYYNILDEVPSDKDIEFIKEGLIKIKKDEDAYCSILCEQFNRFCDKHGIKEKISFERRECEEFDIDDFES